MYEISLSNTLSKTILKLCSDSGWDRIRRILVKIGGIRKVDPELMTFIFAGLTKDTPAEGAILSIMMIPLTLECKSCGRVASREDSELICPLCGSRKVNILSGLELSIEALEVEKDFYKNE